MIKTKEFNSKYDEFIDIDALPETFRQLALKAKEAIKTSYSPYSHFSVGAAVLLENGEIIQGSNQENGAYPSGLCAERVALFYAGSTYPKIPVVAIAIIASYKGKIVAQPISPCGGCRQVMMETQSIGKKPITVIMIGESKVITVKDIGILLPFSFSNIIDATKE